MCLKFRFRAGDCLNRPTLLILSAIDLPLRYGRGTFPELENAIQLFHFPEGS